MTTIDEIITQFDLLDDWDDRYRYVVELGPALESFPDELKTEQNRVPGCVSQLWLWTTLQDKDRTPPSLAIRCLYRPRSGRDPAGILPRKKRRRTFAGGSGRIVRTPRIGKPSDATTLQRLQIDDRPDSRRRPRCARSLRQRTRRLV